MCWDRVFLEMLGILSYNWNSYQDFKIVSVTWSDAFVQKEVRLQSKSQWQLFLSIDLYILSLTFHYIEMNNLELPFLSVNIKGYEEWAH